MYPPLVPFADFDLLRSELGTMLGTPEVKLVHREPNAYASTFPSDILTCQFPDGRKTRLFCKYEGGRTEEGEHYRRGLRYEGAVYRDILEPLQAAVPRFYGMPIDRTTGQMCLVLEYLDGCLPAQKAVWKPEALVLAARWIGDFHARASEGQTRFLLRYDEQHYWTDLENTLVFARRVREKYPSLLTLCRHLETLLPRLANSPQVVIHGEFYPSNILFRQGRVYPVDWQSAALAAGELDLAILTGGGAGDGWDAALIRECELEYCRARWPAGMTHNFEEMLTAARLYWPMIFIGSDRLPDQRRFGFVDELEATGRRSGLI